MSEEGTGVKENLVGHWILSYPPLTYVMLLNKSLMKARSLSLVKENTQVSISVPFGLTLAPLKSQPFSVELTDGRILAITFSGNKELLVVCNKEKYNTMLSSFLIYCILSLFVIN